MQTIGVIPVHLF